MENQENYKEMLSMFLPDGILNYFDCISVRKIDGVLTVRLIEKNTPPKIKEKSKDKKIVSKGFKDFLVDDFPVRGYRVKLLLRRRVWQYGNNLIKKDIQVTFPNTKLNKEFADFLKDADRARANGYR